MVGQSKLIPRAAAWVCLCLATPLVLLYLAHTLVRPKANLYVHASTKSAQEISDVQLLFHALVYSNNYFNAHTVKATCNSYTSKCTTVYKKVFM